MATAIIVSLLLALAAPGKPPATGQDICQVHVILFVPAGVELPAGYQQRVDEIVDYAESFFAQGLKRWGHKDVVMPFRRAAEGHVEVRVMRGKQETSQYKPVTLRAEVMDTLRREKKINDHYQVWWILVYAGETPARFDGFLGGFGEAIGGWAVCNFDTSAGRIERGEPMGSEFLAKLMLKGVLHELGHGLGMPHVGPLDADDAGNTLMGPTHKHHRHVTGRHEQRVYLSEAEAAMLSAHPAFRGVQFQRVRLPKVEVADMTYKVVRRNSAILVSGRVSSKIRPIYAVVADESDARPGEYWTKTYVGKVAEDGSFDVIVTEPAPSGGTLKTWFIFESGDHAGRLPDRAGAIAKTYSYSGGKWNFD